MSKIDTVLQDAITACIARYGGNRWLSLEPGEQTEAIYREMRRIDLEHTKAISQSMPADQLAVSPDHDASTVAEIGMLRSRPSKPEPEKCSATIKTRSSDRCSWRATVMRNGLSYCGFHDPERRDIGRRDRGADEPNVSRQVGRLGLELMR